METPKQLDALEAAENAFDGIFTRLDHPADPEPKGDVALIVHALDRLTLSVLVLAERLSADDG